MRIGEVEVHGIRDGFGRDRGRDILRRPSESGDPWSSHEDLLDENGVLELTYGGFLVRSADRVILIDLGVGPAETPRFVGGDFLENLRVHGVLPEMVTDVMFTHLHFDHIGWASVDGTIPFENATFRLHSADWAHFMECDAPDPRTFDKMHPIRDRIEFFDSSGPLAPGVVARHLPGHTPGSTGYEIHGGGERVLLLGDLAHSALELVEDGWECAFDVDPAAAGDTRNRVGLELIESQDVATLAHLPELAFGRLVEGPAGREWLRIEP